MDPSGDDESDLEEARGRGSNLFNENSLELFVKKEEQEDSQKMEIMFMWMFSKEFIK